MTININKLKKDKRLIHALIGMSYQEFENLVPVFEKVLYEYYLSKPNRKRKPGGGKKGHLKTTEDKLFFILFYIKNYPTFDFLSYLFGKGRGRSCEAVHLYMDILEKALGKKITLPKRQLKSKEEFVSLFPGIKDVFTDAFERRVQRPKDKKKNKKLYSGKKKTHTRKSLIVTDENKRVLLISPTKQGRRHDKRIADKVNLTGTIPDNVCIWADSGFTGLKHKNTMIAKKARKNRPLTDKEKEENRIISSFRVVAEHAIAGIKRFKIMSDVFRNKIGKFDDKTALVTASLWNYKLLYSS